MFSTEVFDNFLSSISCSQLRFMISSKSCQIILTKSSLKGRDNFLRDSSFHWMRICCLNCSRPFLSCSSMSSYSLSMSSRINNFRINYSLVSTGTPWKWPKQICISVIVKNAKLYCVLLELWECCAKYAFVSNYLQPCKIMK